LDKFNCFNIEFYFFKVLKLKIMKDIFLFFQTIVSILLIICILLQQRGSVLGSAFGGEGGFYATRRGIEKKIFWLTCILGALFLLCGILNLWLSR